MYPLKGTAAQVVGFAGMDNEGLAGIELVYDEQLSGKPGSETVVQDPAGHTLRTVHQKLPVSGSDVRLTLDSEIQYTAEDVLEKTVRSTGGKSAMGIVMDPRTGEVLAMANVTGEGFHGFGKDKEADKNRCITDVYEPGSIFKVVTISGALADGTVTPEQKFTLPPSIWVSDREINESHPRGTVTYTVGEILQWSSNVGAVTIGQKMGPEDLYKWEKAFGFGALTGIDFPGESGGIVKAPGGLVGVVHRQHPDGPGHRRHGHADDLGVQHRGVQRLAGPAAAGRPGGDRRLRHGGEAPRAAGQGRPPGARDAARRRRGGHRHQGAHPRLRRGRQDGHRGDGAVGRQRLRQGRLHRLVRRHGAGRPPAAGRARGGQRHARCTAATPPRRRSRRSCSSRSSTWRSRRDRGRGGRKRAPGWSARIRADEAERAGSRGLRRHGARGPGHRDPGSRLPHA